MSSGDTSCSGESLFCFVFWLLFFLDNDFKGSSGLQMLLRWRETSIWRSVDNCALWRSGWTECGVSGRDRTHECKGQTPRGGSLLPGWSSSRLESAAEPGRTFFVSCLLTDLFELCLALRNRLSQFLQTLNKLSWEFPFVFQPFPAFDKPTWTAAHTFDYCRTRIPRRGPLV